VSGSSFRRVPGRSQRNLTDPRHLAALIVLAVIALLAAVAARADAAPRPSIASRAGRDVDVAQRSAWDHDDEQEEDDYRVADSLVDVPYAPHAWTERVAALDGPCDCDASALARVTATAPSLASIVARAQAVAGFANADDPTVGWRRRSRWSALLPSLSIRVGNSQSWRDILDPAVAASASGAPSTLNHSISYDARVSWHLDHLLYDPHEPRFTAFEVARRRERRKLSAVASRAYFVWVRASIAVERDGRWQLRLAEAAAQLDALTDGWFSEELSRRSPP
jgi:hypothetical protein